MSKLSTLKSGIANYAAPYTNLRAPNLLNPKLCSLSPKPHTPKPLNPQTSKLH